MVVDPAVEQLGIFRSVNEFEGGNVGLPGVLSAPLAGDACRGAPRRTPMAPIDSCNTNCAARMTNTGLRFVNR